MMMMMDWSKRGNILKRGSSWEPFRKNSALTGESVMVQRKMKLSGAQRKCLRKQKETPYNS